MLILLTSLAVESMAEEPTPASLIVFAKDRAAQPIPRELTGKFAEQMTPGRGWNSNAQSGNVNKGDNIYNGMEAQVLRNPTFAAWSFGNGQADPDGGVMLQNDREKVAQTIRRSAPYQGWPEREIEGMLISYQDGLACWWTRVGSRTEVQVSPDTGSRGGRAQRIEVKAGGQGIAQWTYLPLHRTRKFEFRLYARALRVRDLTVSLSASDSADSGSQVTVSGLGDDWRWFSGTLEVPDGVPADAPCRFAIVANEPGQFVLARALLLPSDHVNGADPDVVRLLKESRLPLLRWPGGNFTSAYHWEDGVGPTEYRPTRPNYAWGGTEPNLFGTDEFMAFCRSVGCEPLLCVNCGSGTPEEAVRWLEYCNGSTDTPMGQLRAANGHPEPYHVTRWEVGNELWGRGGQYNWTTPSGYVDRYMRFARLLLAADPNLKLYACGAQGLRGSAWNDTLIAGAAPMLHGITDHPLVGGKIPADADPLDVYRDFMAVPQVLERKWGELREKMTRAGIKDPRLGLTELQLFATIGPARTATPARLTQANLVNPSTLGEALYDVLIYHAAVRLGPFLDMITHSATVNHGGGLRKEHESVYANPCHYAQSAFADLAGATAVRTEVEAPTEAAPLVMPSLHNATSGETFKTVDAVAALTPEGNLLLSIVYRGTSGPARLAVEIRDFAAAPLVAVHTLSGPAPWAANSLQNPDLIKPVDTVVEAHNGRLTIDLKPYSVLRVRVSPR